MFGVLLGSIVLNVVVQCEMEVVVSCPLRKSIWYDDNRVEELVGQAFQSYSSSAL